MRRSVLVLLCALILCASLPLHGKAAFSGTYAVKGNNPGVGPYTGTLTIAPRGQIFDVVWTVANVQYSGVGVVVNDTLSVAYSGGNGSWMGVMGYRQKADGTLEGKWAVYGGKTQTGTETGTRK